jgi:hypothetical protein
MWQRRRYDDGFHALLEASFTFGGYDVLHGKVGLALMSGNGKMIAHT